MKKITKNIIIGFAIGIFILVSYVIISNYFSNSEPKEIFCPDYDGKQEKCLLHEECKWMPEENICNSVFAVENDEGYNEDEDKEWLVPELEEIEISDTLPNQLCKQIPLSGKPPYNQRYTCLAIVNHDERFCEGVDEEKEKNMCLAYAKKDSSYCKKVKTDEAKHTCYYQLAVSSNDASFCSDIDYSQNEKEQCYYNFMSNLYQLEEYDKIKTEYCNELDTADKNTCLALKEKDVSLCNDNPWCLTHFVQELSFCDEHPEITSCMNDRAKTSKNVSICELLSQPKKDNCIGGYCTHIELDVKICDMIEDIIEKESRYLEVAMNLANGY